MPCNRRIMLQVIQDHRKWHDSIGDFLLVVCIKNVSILYQFRDITTFTVYVTTCDLQKSFRLKMTVEITGHVYVFQFLCKHIVANSTIFS